MFVIPSANDLITFIKDFTGSIDDAEIKKCIFLAELSMRNVELPALRCDPYAPENIGVADVNGRIPIPGDMNKPILFFKQGRQYLTRAYATGDVGSDIITLASSPSKSLGLGMTVTGDGIGVGATIIAFPEPNVNVIQLSIPNTANVANNVTFNTGGNTSSQTGPWIVYDRIGDRDIITQSMIAQLYLQPVNVPAVIRGKFSEVGQQYEFLPYIAEGDLINLYYYKAWPLLFSPVSDELIAETGTVSISSGTTATLTIVDTSQIKVNDTLTATSGTGSFGPSKKVVVTEVVNSTTVLVKGVGIVNGVVNNIYITDITVQNNAVLNTWPEGYVYGTLREYYMKRHNDQDAGVYAGKFQQAWDTVEDQNNLGKWSGGHTRLTSVWQPRQYRQYNIK